MAQIIKHRRGSLESISSATKRAGELLVVTGSAGIDATNGNSILFVGIDGSTATPANKVLQGSTNPNLTGAAYDTSIDGIPFYNTSTEKLYILNKGGNVEVKATANTGGSGIVSGSAQVEELLPAGTVSGSSQVELASTVGFSSFSSSVENKNATLASYTASVDSKFSSVGSYTASQDSKNSTLAVYTASIDTALSNQETKNSTLATYTGSLETKNSTLATYTGSVDSKFSSVGSYTASQDSKNSTLATYTASVDTALSNQATKNSAVASYTGSVNDKFSTLGTYTGSVDSKFSSVGSYTASQDSKNSTLATYTASVDADLVELYATASNHEGRVDSLESFSQSFDSAFNLNGNDVEVIGNLTVKGTTTTVDSTTIQLADNIIELNGSGVANGGLYVKDDTAPNNATGSLVWDSTLDYWKAGVKDSESKVLVAGGDSVVSGSSQITISDTTGYADFSGSIASSISASVAASTWTNLNGKPAGIVSGSSQVVDYLVGQDISVGVISGSAMNLTGNASINGNVLIGGNITIGDETSDTVSFGANISSDIVPSADNTYDLGSAEEKFAEIHASNLYGTINGVVNATNGVISGSSQVNADSITNFDTNVKDKLNVEGVISGSSQVNADSITNFDSNVLAYNNSLGLVSGSGQVRDLLPTGVVSGSSQVLNLLPAGTLSGSSQLDGKTIDDALLTNVEASGSFNGVFVGDGSGITGLSTTLSVSGSNGSNDTVNLKGGALSFAGGTGVSITVASDTATISVQDSSTSVKGIASFDADDFSVTSGNVSIKSNGVRATNLNSDVAGTGISLNAVNNSIEVDYGSSAGSSVEGNTSLTVTGTANEIEISGGSITLGNGGTVTIGLPDSVTIATASIQQDLTVGRNLTVDGNLYVNGTTTTIDSTTIQLGDNIIELNGSGGANAGLLVKDVTNPNTASGSLLWNSTSDFWMGGALGSEKEFARFNSTPSSGSVQVVSENGLLVNSQISDDAIKVTIGTDLVINGLSASSFLVSNGSKKLISVSPTNAGDMVQWNGSSFIASNEIDGGSF
jgi:hypothetical protein